jgi:SAM-dependent methyltransferase
MDLGSASSLRLLDIGCGTGANLPLLRARVGKNGSVTAMDFSPLALQFARDDLLQCEAANKDTGQHDTQQNDASGNLTLLRGDALHLPFCDDSFDAVTMLDVLEHLSDDRLALAEVRRVLRPGGALVMSVPAYQKLWSAHDEALHHFRRYEFHGLRRLLRRSGFTVPLLSFAMSLMPPIAWMWRRFILPFKPRRPRDATRHSEGAVLPAVPPALNRALIRYLEVEGSIIARRPLRFGTSLVAVAIKR